MERSRKIKRYKRVLIQIEELIQKTTDPLGRMSTIVAILHHKFEYFFWTGFYRLIDGELTVSCYQGSVACLVLEKHTGVCWTAIDEKKIQIVPDVHKFPGHIACDSRSASEIVIPIWKNNKIVAVLDVDSKELDSFNEIDAEFLEKIVGMVY
ncbi:MAG: GAF domain-containing protein [Candidatus Cloacimonetes bacterium]|jgi:GAF domain-containing protein|nr:GAF domain-containing protein [Candidatus Cloacimonadota bacterium]MBT4576295.1 GAF domain-containing protein [Candidatus Cloacimonadota bacterium]